MRINDRGPADLALRALRDSGLIRAPLRHPGFCQLWGNMLADDGPAMGDLVDFRLTDRGLAMAAQLKPWDETR